MRNAFMAQVVHVLPLLLAQIFIQHQVKQNVNLIKQDAYIIVANVMLLLLRGLVLQHSHLESQQILKNLFIVEVSKKQVYIVD